VSGAPPVVWVVAGERSARRWVAALREAELAAGALVWAAAASLLEGRAPGDPGLGACADADLVLFTSRHAALVLPDGHGAGRLAACVGRGTAEAAAARGYDVVLVGARGSADLAARLVAERKDVRRVLWPCGRDARREAPDVLEAAGLDVVAVPVYAMVEAPDFAARVGAAPEPAAIVLGSPRAVLALETALATAGRDLPAATVLAVLGSVTAERAAATFERYVAQASRTDGAGLARAVTEALARAIDERS